MPVSKLLFTYRVASLQAPFRITFRVCQYKINRHRVGSLGSNKTHTIKRIANGNSFVTQREHRKRMENYVLNYDQKQPIDKLTISSITCQLEKTTLNETMPVHNVQEIMAYLQYSITNIQKIRLYSSNEEIISY